MLDLRMGKNGAVVFCGRFDASQASKAAQFLNRLERLNVLDFLELEYISSAGLGVLLKTQKRVLDTCGTLKLINVSMHIGDIFKYSGLDQVFEIELADAG